MRVRDHALPQAKLGERVRMMMKGGGAFSRAPSMDSAASLADELSTRSAASSSASQGRWGRTVESRLVQELIKTSKGPPLIN